MADVKIAIMGDAHANPRSLRAAIDDAKSLGCNRLVFLGDCSGYGYDIKETVRLVRESFDIVLLGNHDAICSDRFPSELHNRNYDIDRMEAKQLEESELEWLRGLPLVHAEEDIAYVHGDFSNPRAFHYVQEPGDVLESCYSREERILFCAHLHLSSVWEVESDATVTRLSETSARLVLAPELNTFRLKSGCRYVVNCGSVGHPRFERAIVYAILDRGAGTVSVRRLPFDAGDYGKEMRCAGLSIPDWLECENASGRHPIR